MRFSSRIRRLGLTVLLVLLVSAALESGVYRPGSRAWGVYQEQIDHFSDDKRAMSPRSWGQSSSLQTALPEISFKSQSTTASDSGSRTPFQQVESSKLRQPKQYYESQQLQLGAEAQEDDSASSPVPKSVLNPGTNDNSYPLTDPQNDVFDESKYDGVADDSVDFESTLYGQTYLDRSCDENTWLNSDEAVRLKTQPSHLAGHRYRHPIERGFVPSSTTKFSFEEDGDFPPASEILAQSIFFSEFDLLFVQPSFQNNTAVTISDGPSLQANPFNFDLETAFRMQVGFESEYGPGFAAEYFQFDNDSDVFNFVSDGIVAGRTNVEFLGGAFAPNSLVADNAGERLESLHSLELHSTSVFAFKAIKFKRAYVNGRFGIQIVSIEQVLESRLFDSANNPIGQLNHSSNLDAFGPRFGIDYVRKIGHTPAQLIASSTSSILFGDRDQFIQNTVTNENISLGGDEFVTVFDIFLGVQGKRIRGEKRNFTYRIGFVNQSWIGAGSALNPDSNLGFQGISLMVGFNR